MSTFLAIDFETANHSPDSACSIGLVRVQKGQIRHQSVHLIRPPTSQFFFTNVHGLRWNDVKDSPTFGELWPTLATLFRDVDYLTAHNAAFDARVLAACCQRYGIELPQIPFNCTMRGSRKFLEIYPTNLPAVCRTLNIPLNHHEALSDALACAQIAIHIEKTRDTPETSGPPR